MNDCGNIDPSASQRELRNNELAEADLEAGRWRHCRRQEIARTPVLISFDSADAGKSRDIEAAMRQTGLNAKLVPMSQDPVDQAAAECVVVLWSYSCSRSQWVKRETELAVDAWSNDRLVLGALDDSELPKGLRDLDRFNLYHLGRAGVVRLAEQVASTVRAQQPGMAAAGPGWQGPWEETAGEKKGF